MEVVSTTASEHWDLIFGIERNPDEEDQYTAVVTMHPPNSIQRMLKGEILDFFEKYIVETGSLDEISKYKEVGAFSEWPLFRFSYSIDPSQHLNDRDLKFTKWIEKMSKGYMFRPEAKVEHRKKKWWKRLLGM